MGTEERGIGITPNQSRRRRRRDPFYSAHILAPTMRLAPRAVFLRGVESARARPTLRSLPNRCPPVRPPGGLESAGLSPSI